MGTTLTGQATAEPPSLANPDAVRAFLMNQAAIGVTPRFRMLDRKEAFARCLEYAHQPRDWNGNQADDFESIQPRATMPAGWEYADPQADLPVKQKRPTAPSREAKKIVNRFTGMLFSESRKPTVRVEGDPDTEDFLREVVKQAGFWRQLRAARNHGGGMGSVLVTVHARDGRFAYEVHNPKHVPDIVWKDKSTGEILGVLIMYSSIRVETRRDERGRVIGNVEVEWLHRRIITTAEDLTYIPERADGPLNWQVDPNLYVRHDLGFFPGVWIQNTEDAEDVDGDSDCEGAYEEIDTIDRMYAQTNKALLANLDPTLVTAYDPKKLNGLDPYGNGGVIRTGSQYAIDLPEGGEAHLLEMSGAAVDAAMKYCDNLRRSVHELCRVVMIDPEKISGAAQSAKAIEYLFQPMIERCDELRDIYGHAIVKLLEVTERIARQFEGATTRIPHPDTGDQVEVPFAFDLPPRIARRLEADGQEHVGTEPRRLGPGGGSITLEWGPYFQTTETDDSLRIANAAAAKQGGLVTGATATKHVAPVFGIEDPDREQQAASSEEEAQTARALAGMDGGVRPDDLTDARERRGPQAAAGGRP